MSEIEKLSATNRSCPICNKENISNDDSWAEFGFSYHISCMKDQEKEDKPFHKNYQTQKRLGAKQVLEVLDLLNDKDFVEYWLNICCSEEERDKLYDHPILWSRNNEEGLDLFP